MQEDSDKIVLIVGAGSVVNSWQPIIKVLQPDFDFEMDSDGANSFLARAVYMLRFVATVATPGSNIHLQKMIRDVNEIKSRICKELIIAEKSKLIKAQKEFEAILDKFVFFKNNKFVVISTNWDTVIDNQINIFGSSNFPKPRSKIETFHLHGSILSPTRLYLPSEVAKESYRTEQESSEMLSLHASTLTAISESNKTILYGLSLDPLDAELCQILALGWSSSNLKEIIIINPDYKKVVQRVKLLLGFDKIKISCYCPNNLNKKIDF
jgi:hypothetical protein